MNKVSKFRVRLFFWAFSMPKEAGERMTNTYGRGAPKGRLDFEIRVIPNNPRVAVGRWRAANRGTVPDSTDWRRERSLVFEFPQPVPVYGEPGENGETGHDHTNTDNEAGEGAWVLCSSLVRLRQSMGL